MKNLIATTAIAVLALGTAAYAGDAQPNMVPVNKGAFKQTVINADVDLSKYSKIMIADGGIEFREMKKGPKYSSLRSSNQRDFYVNEKDQAKAEAIISKAFGEQVVRSKHFEVVNEAGPDVLVIHGSLKDFVSHVPPQMAGPGETYLSKIATATIELVAVDSISGEVVFAASERSKIEARGREMIEANSVMINSELRRWTKKVTSKLVKGLDSIHS